MKIEQIIEIVSNSNLKDNSELITALGNLVSPDAINLELILTNEKFAVLNKEIQSKVDAGVGSARSKWDAEIKKAKEDEEIAKEKKPEQKGDTLQQILDGQKAMSERLNQIEKAKADDFKLKNIVEAVKSKDIFKNLNEASQNMAMELINSNSTEEDVSNILSKFNNLEKSFKTTGSPGTSLDNSDTNKISQAGTEAFNETTSRLDTKYNLREK